MPGGDRTGPLGAGPMTGRGAGFCNGSGMPGYASPWGGRGAGWGRGGGGRGGRGFRHRFHATGLPGWARLGGGAPGPVDERDWLEQRSRALEAELGDLRRRLADLEQRGERGGTE